jgi:hypothetical protein
VIGWVPDQVPGSAVSVWPTCGVPEIVGGDVLTGADWDAVTVAVWLETAVLEPPPFEAVTATRIVEPTSADVSAYVCAVAPAISEQVDPDASHRRHWYA